MGLHVLVAGAGIGGLCLAQGLRKAGIQASVFERDSSVGFRAQGYRFRIDPHGDNALKQCLPDNLYALYLATSNQPSRPPAGAFDAHLNLIYKFPDAAAGLSHIAVDRQTLRQILLGDLDVRFDKRVIKAVNGEESVRVCFEDGDEVEGDLLIAADGWNSALRTQLLPDAEVDRLGMNCICGKIPLNDEILAMMPEALYAGFTPILGPERRTLGMGMFRSRTPMESARAEFAPSISLVPAPDYLMWILVYPEDDQSGLDHALHLTEGWDENIRTLLKQSDPASLFRIPLTCSRPVTPWPTTRTTFLGDSIHAMTPAGGIGANTAMRDAALLTALLSDNPLSLYEAIASYENQIREYGFSAVQTSLKSASYLYRFTGGVK